MKCTTKCNRVILHSDHLLNEVWRPNRRTNVGARLWNRLPIFFEVCKDCNNFKIYFLIIVREKRKKSWLLLLGIWPTQNVYHLDGFTSYTSSSHPLTNLYNWIHNEIRSPVLLLVYYLLQPSALYAGLVFTLFTHLPMFTFLCYKCICLLHQTYEINKTVTKTVNVKLTNEIYACHQLGIYQQL